MTTLSPLPTTLDAPDGIVTGLFSGALGSGQLRRLPGRGRVRRWWYVAATNKDGSLAIGAAIVDLGMVGTTFVWVADHEDLREFSRRIPGPRVRVGAHPGSGAQARGRGFHVDADGRGGLDLHIDDFHGRPLSVTITTPVAAPVVCATPTPLGGVNVTQKSAGHACQLRIQSDGGPREMAGAGWYDWTSGRQDRQTQWRWAAGAGRSRDGRRVGLNLSTGMNGVGPGEDVVWVDDEPIPVNVTRLAPVVDGEFDGPWDITGDTWALRFTPSGIRAASENLVLVRSRYVQPYGMFSGTVPAPGGGTIDVVAMPGVTEDHEALW